MVGAEKMAASEVDAVLFSSPVDCDSKVASGKGFLVRSPHMVGVNSFPYQYDHPFPIVFVGRLSYRANVEAIEWFADNVVPELGRYVPGAKLYVVGQSPSRRVRALEGPRVHVIGEVDSVSPYILGARASIIPVTMATGVQMKLIESCALGVPVVATGTVAHQAGVKNGREVLVADSVEEWVGALQSLQTEPKLASRVASSGMDWAVTNYSDESISRSIEELMVRVMERHR
ncbi:glycosyltransferase family 4 protein [Acidipropionibacterium jensenii]|uniref:glycosyltransferase family 4 protein n=1 Tax=Acidipropionibacterium jensenii TaxID=1749 RepID=UPI001586DC59|nr:glycosyltransferase family 4 protein [Acidipropionibacterium jensenii]